MKIVTILKASVLLVFFYALLAPLLKENTFSPVTEEEHSVTATTAEPEIEQPLHNVDLPDFLAIQDVKAKKKAFFSFLKPAILSENKKLNRLRKQVVALSNKLKSNAQLDPSEMSFIAKTAKKYKIKNKLSVKAKVAELMNRVDTVPLSLVLVQAANESAWGTSRFAKIGLNFFGMWCYKKGCGMVPNGRDTGLKHEVAAFNSVEHAVQRYLHNINTNYAYNVLRNIRAQLHEQNLPITAEILATGLLPYSERGTDYILELTEMIRHNKRYF